MNEFKKIMGYAKTTKIFSICLLSLIPIVLLISIIVTIFALNESSSVTSFLYSLVLYTSQIENIMVIVLLVFLIMLKIESNVISNKKIKSQAKTVSSCGIWSIGVIWVGNILNIIPNYGSYFQYTSAIACLVLMILVCVFSSKLIKEAQAKSNEKKVIEVDDEIDSIEEF